MGVGGKGEAGAAVAQHTGHGLDINSVLQGEGRKGVPQIVEADMLQPGILENFLMQLYHRIGMVHATGHWRGEQVGNVGVFVVFLFQKLCGFFGQGNFSYGIVSLGRLYR